MGSSFGIFHILHLKSGLLKQIMKSIIFIAIINFNFLFYVGTLVINSNFIGG